MPIYKRGIAVREEATDASNACWSISRKSNASTNETILSRDYLIETALPAAIGHAGAHGTGVMLDALLSARHHLTTTCEWREDECGAWETSCGHIFEFNDGGPTENKQQFCGYCGGRLIEHRYEELSEVAP